VTPPITATGTNGARISPTTATTTASIRVNISAGRFSSVVATTSGASASGTVNSESPRIPTWSSAIAITRTVSSVNTARMLLLRYTAGSSTRR